MVSFPGRGSFKPLRIGTPDGRNAADPCTPKPNIAYPPRVSQSTDVDRTRETAGKRSVKQLVLLSGVFLVLQVASTDYGGGPEEPTAAIVWLALGAVLLWLVYRRRSRVARAIIIVTSFLGAVIYALASIDEAHAGLLAVFYVGQALPLLATPIRRHVQVAHRQG